MQLYEISSSRLYRLQRPKGRVRSVGTYTVDHPLCIFYVIKFSENVMKRFGNPSLNKFHDFFEFLIGGENFVA